MNVKDRGCSPGKIEKGGVLGRAPVLEQHLYGGFGRSAGL